MIPLVRAGILFHFVVLGKRGFGCCIRCKPLYLKRDPVPIDGAFEKHGNRGGHTQTEIVKQCFRRILQVRVNAHVDIGGIGSHKNTSFDWFTYIIRHFASVVNRI